MTTAALLPEVPSELDFQVYRWTVVEGHAPHRLAEAAGVEVSTIYDQRSRVIAWMAQQMPADDPLSKAQRQRAAECLAWERLDHLHSLALEAWKGSKRGDIVKRQNNLAGTSTTSRTTEGNISYLLAACRISISMSRLPLVYVPTDKRQELAAQQAAQEADEIWAAAAAKQSDAAERASAAAKADNHPNVDCSPASDTAPVAAAEASGDTVASVEAATPCVDDVEPVFGGFPLLDDEFSPVHLPGDERPTLDLRTSRGLKLHPPQSRKERRKQRRLAAKSQRQAS